MPPRSGTPTVLLVLFVATIALACGAFSATAADNACQQTASTPASVPSMDSRMSEPDFPEKGSISVFAAASLTDAFEAIAAEITEAHPDIEIAFNFAGSQTLATQLAQGAPADIFASADEPQMQTAMDAGVVDGDPRIFANNQLVIVVPTGNPGSIDTPADLASDDIRLVVAQPDVPVGRYTQQALCLMASAPETHGDTFADRVEANIVSEEQDVRAVLTKVQLGEADAGIVYASDITADVAEDIEVITIPDVFNVTGHYPIAPVAGGTSDLAEAFIAYVLGPEGQQILEDYGFTPIG